MIVNIAVFEAEPIEEKYLRKSLGKISFCKEALSEKNYELARDSSVISVFIYSRIDGALLKKLPGLRMIATRSTGFDHIDLAACRKRGVTVCNVPFYGENTVAEHTFALILSLSRNIHKTYVRTIKKDFSLDGLRGFDLKGKTIGVIGAGHIGLHVIRMAKGFGMNALAYDVRTDSFLSEVLGFRYAPLDEILRGSDIISLHAPLNDHTFHMISKKTIRMIKKGAILINTSRGGLVDTEALIEALDNGILSGAGLDVFEGENVIKDDKHCAGDKCHKEELKRIIQTYNLLERENVVITPHNAFNSVEAVHRILDTTISNINSYASGKPQNIVG